MNKQKIAKELLSIAKDLAAADTFKCPTCSGKVLEQTGYCVKCKKKVKKAKEISGGTNDVYDTIGRLVISYSPPQYAKAAKVVEKSYQFKFDYMKKLHKSLVKLAKMQDLMEKNHDEMSDLWSEVGRRERKVNSYL